jgi:Aspartyl/Asparaginyl beta-hydroxylase
MVNALKLPFSFDADALKADLGRVCEEEWAPHFNQDYYEGACSGVALRSVGGASLQLFADPSRATTYADTPLLGRCEYFGRVTEAFECPLESVRLLRLGAGSRIREHSDFDLGLRYGVVRVHVPVRTDAEVEFVVGGERVLMCEGESWYLNLSLPHRVENRGAADRVHVVIDCVVNEWVRSFVK